MRRWPVTLLALAGLGPTPSPARAATPSAFDLASGPAVRIAVRAEGWTRVSQPALVAAGLAPGVDPARPPPLHRRDRAGDPAGRRRRRDLRSRRGAGVLRRRPGHALDGHAHLLAHRRGSRRQARAVVAHAGGGPAAGSFLFTAAMRARRVYYAALKNGEGSNYFAVLVDGNGKSETLRLPPRRGVGRRRRCASSSRASPSAPRRRRCRSAASRWGRAASRVRSASTCTLAPAGRRRGRQLVGFVGAGVAPDYSLVATVELDYAHAFTADDDRLTFTAPPVDPARPSAASRRADVRVFDVTDADARRAGHRHERRRVGLRGTVNTRGRDERPDAARGRRRRGSPRPFRSPLTARRPGSSPLAGELVVLSPARVHGRGPPARRAAGAGRLERPAGRSPGRL